MVLLELNHIVLLISLALYLLLGMASFWLLFVHLSHRRRSLAREARLLAAPLPADLPHVLVQLPTFNEGALIKRLAACVDQLRWPRDRLHVQILDDSTDGSEIYAGEAAAALRAHGLDAVVLHRSQRKGYKAGALAEGLRHSTAGYVAILDADYLPSPDFLEQCIRPFLADSTMALVQARCDYLNGSENAITRAQQRILDAHYAIEQPARNWAGQIMPFNGTCGMWRRCALDAAGDWQGDTLAEDMDVSYRAQLMGWRAMFLISVAVPGELPRSFGAWRQQQFRWTKGSAQVMRKLLPAILMSQLSWRQKMGSTFHLGMGAFGPLFLVGLVSGLIETLFGGGLSRAALVMIVLAAIETNAGPALLQISGQVLTRKARLSGELIQVPAAIGLQLLVGLANLRGAVEALAGRSSAFVRTAKQGTALGTGVTPS